MKMRFSAAFILSLMTLMVIAFFAAPAKADWISTSDQNGALKTTFYNNETVYVASGNITSTSQSVRVYVVENNNSWVENKTLIDVTGTGYITQTTNSSGHLVVTLLWDNPAIGIYDVVADTKEDAEYNSTYDFVNSTTATGFTVLAAPTPSLTVAAGLNNPSSHDWDLEADTGHNSMLQLNFTSTIESVRINSLSLTATGTGDDEEDVTVAYLILDDDADGEYDQGEDMLDYKDYFFDNGVVTFEIDGGHVVPTDGSVAMLITYMMSSSGQAGSTYKFDIVAISAEGADTTETASVTGLPLGSAITTISGSAPDTTTTTTTTVPTDECQTDEDCGGVACTDKQKTIYTCRYDSNTDVNVCASTIVSVTCCADGDCIEGYYCLNYRCVQEGDVIGSLFGGMLAERDYTLIIVSIVVVIALAVALFFIIKNRKDRRWKSRREYESEWKTLRGKWGEKKE
jgi:hypothetical protein